MRSAIKAADDPSGIMAIFGINNGRANNGTFAEGLCYKQSAMAPALL
jgi:hypothetical protein